MNDMDELIAALRERAASDSPAHTLMNEAADALEAATRVPGQGEPNNDRENLITERTYGHGSITLTHYRSSGRIGVVQRGENSVMDVADLLVFLQDSGLDEVFSRATVPDAATEELDKVTLDRLQELAEKRGYDKGFAAGWKSGGKTADLLVPKLRKAQAERDAALARIAEAAELHQPEVIGVHEGQGAEVWCPHCETYWPCPTVVALGLNEGENDD